MKSLCLKCLPILFGILPLAGCKTLPVATHAIGCEASAELLASKCAAPRPLANDATYAALVDTMQADRKALQECSNTTDALRDALQRCNQASDEYNNKIDTLNRTQ